MPKVSTIQSNFNGGEISPLVYGRVDAPRYKESLAICQNYLPLIQGPITRRPGTSFVFPTKNSGDVARLIPFEFSTTQAYMLEFGNNYIRFFKNYGIITNSPVALTSITKANPAVVTSNAHGFLDGDHVVVQSILGMTELNNREFIISSSAANTYQLTDNITGLVIDSSGFTAYVSGGTTAKIYEVSVHKEAVMYAETISNANPASVLLNKHGYSSGDKVKFTNVPGMTQLSNNTYTITVVDVNNFTLGVDSTAYGVLPSDVRVECARVSTGTFNVSDLPLIKYCQSNDVLYLVHPSYPPKKLTRMGDTNWTLDNITFVDGPYLDANITNTTLLSTHTVSSIGDEQTITASSTYGINSNSGFLSTDVGRWVRLQNADGSFGNCRITTVTSTTQIQAHTYNTTKTAGPTSVSNWRLGLWSDTTGYPTSVVFHENRLVFGGCAYSPTRFDGSLTSDFENFAPSGAGRNLVTASTGVYDVVNGSSATIASNNAYSFSLSSNDVNGIVWMTSDEQGLVIGTTGAEWKVSSADSTQALSPTSVSAKRTTSFGSDSIQAAQSGKNTIFVQRGGRKLRELNYYFDVNGFRASDLTQLSEHITQSTVVFMAVQKSPQPFVWVVRTDGTLVSMTYERDLDVLKVGWARHVLGGSSQINGATTYQSQVESVAVIPNSNLINSNLNGQFQDVWITVQRFINGKTVRYVEYINQLFDTSTPISSAFFVDAGLTYNGTATSTVSGLNHLNGQTVSVLADGSPQENIGVIAGRINLSVTASIITIGLPYNSDGQKLRSDAGAADGTAMGKIRRIHRVGIQLLNTLGFQIGADFNTLDQITLDSTDAGILSNSSQSLFSGISTQPLSMDYDFDNMFCWRQNQPLPGTISGLYPIQETQDRG